MLEVQSFALFQIVCASSQTLSDLVPGPGTLEMALQAKAEGTPALLAASVPE